MYNTSTSELGPLQRRQPQLSHCSGAQNRTAALFTYFNVCQHHFKILIVDEKCTTLTAGQEKGANLSPKGATCFRILQGYALRMLAYNHIHHNQEKIC